MMQYVTVNEKVTTWIRNTVQVEGVETKQEAIDKVIECYNNGGDPFNYNDMDVIDSVELSECEEAISVEENNGSPTVEVVAGNQIIWTNA